MSRKKREFFTAQRVEKRWFFEHDVTAEKGSQMPLSFVRSSTKVRREAKKGASAYKYLTLNKKA